jgi:DNA-binding NarL/FixJ family response regulator
MMLKVLLVEDSKILAGRLSNLIAQMPNAELVGVAETQSAAVDFLERETVDIIILDLHLRQGTGFGVMRALPRLGVQPRIIVLTNYDLPEYREVALSLGAEEVLDKALDYGRLPEVLQQAEPTRH